MPFIYHHANVRSDQEVSKSLRCASFGVLTAALKLLVFWYNDAVPISS